MQFYGNASNTKIHTLNRTYISIIDSIAPNVFNAFVQTCESEYLARLAITYGEGPILQIQKLCRNGYHDTSTLGYYPGLDNPSLKNYVYINTNVADNYKLNGASEQYIAQTVLHEMVHWARYIGGKSERIDDREAGLVFEERAFGIAIGSDYGKTTSVNDFSQI